MTHKSIIAAAAAFALVGGCATSTEAKAPPVTYTVVKENTSIPFASNIRNYRTGKDVEKSLLLEGSNGLWYRAKLDQFCARALPWQNAIAVVQDATNSFDRFSSVLIDGQRCRVLAVDQIVDPDQARRAAAAAQPR